MKMTMWLTGCALMLMSLVSMPKSAVSNDSNFVPRKEAEVPEGWPDYTPVGKVELKQYPAYRLAKVDSGGAAFWTLFSHIKKNKIEMTAPVEMQYDNADSGSPREQSMAFLYGSPETGSTGSDGRVEVTDVAAMQAVSIGVRGRRNTERVENAREQLAGWLSENEGSYEANGPLRVLGYNSPFVPASQQYFEVQIPVRSVK